MRDLQTISYFSHDVDVTTKRKAATGASGKAAISEKHRRYMRAFIRHLQAKKWEKCVRYLKKLSKTNLFLTTIARGGFIIADASNCSRRDVINKVIEQINARNKKAWLKGVTFDGYVNMVANTLYTEFRCDSVAAFYVIKSNKIRLNRGWSQGMKPDELVHSLRR